MTRVAVIRDPCVPAGSGGFASIQTVAPAFGVELIPVGVRDANEIERGIVAFARGSNDGWIRRWPPSSVGVIPLDPHALRPAPPPCRLPSLYFANSGGLISYCRPDLIDQYRRSAGYVDRILRGEKPADLPVQAPTKYELVINLKTAKALSLACPRRCLPAPMR